MAILRGNARLLLDEARRRPFSGSLLELSRMLVFFSDDELREWADLHGVTLKELEDARLSHHPRVATHGCMDDRTFFRALGFSDVLCTDASAYDGADRVIDLNLPLPADLHGRFDAVIDCGTIQHVFNIPQLLSNVHAALKPDGRAIFGMVASHNQLDHGFYMLSPILFHGWFSLNGWQINQSWVFEFENYWIDGRMVSPPWDIYRYQTESFHRLSYGGFGRRMGGLFFAATRTAQSTGDKVPHQGYYSDLWALSEAASNSEVKPRKPKPGAAMFSRIARRHPALLRTLHGIKHMALVLARWLPQHRPPVDLRY